MANISHPLCQRQSLSHNGRVNLFAPLSVVRQIKEREDSEKAKLSKCSSFFSNLQFCGGKNRDGYKCSFHYFPSLRTREVEECVLDIVLPVLINVKMSSLLSLGYKM